MRKIITLVIALTLLFSFCSCAGTGEKETPASQENGTIESPVTESPVTEIQQAQPSETMPETTARQSHQEYFETYFIYAESGAVVTWFDSQTGEYNYKWKCESYGTTQGGETVGNRLISNGASSNDGFTCTNPNCAMWGKSQRAIIKCNVTG
ncbi:MAG: hypothetical protein II685_02955, partial [Clostridia bacterium]|nr:hypothetical protein [Clostridia bacterium]